METKNKTTLNYKMAMKFNFDNLIYRMRFNLIVFPLLIIASALIIRIEVESFNAISIAAIICAIIIPLTIILTNVIAFSLNAKKDEQIANGKEIEYSFNSDGFTIKKASEENASALVTYAYVKNIVEYKTFYVTYFNGAKPIILDKSGFVFASDENFKCLMKKCLGKRFVQKKFFF